MVSATLSTEQADLLLHLSKRLINQDEDVLYLARPKNRFLLVSETADPKLRFMFEFTKCGISLSKVTYHFQMENRIALTRFDFGSGHQNPKTEFGAPEIAKRYIGYRFDNEAHVHVFSPTHQLDWAVPIREIGLDVDFSEDGGFDIQRVLTFFCDYIGLRDRIMMQGCLNV